MEMILWTFIKTVITWAQLLLSSKKSKEDCLEGTFPCRGKALLTSQLLWTQQPSSSHSPIHTTFPRPGIIPSQVITPLLVKENMGPTLGIFEYALRTRNVMSCFLPTTLIPLAKDLILSSPQPLRMIKVRISHSPKWKCI